MKELETRRMGRTEMRPRSLGLGAAFLSHNTEGEVVCAIHRALALGINYLDTYPGHNESYWGKALRGVPREEYYLQAKLGTHPERRKDFSADGTRWSAAGRGGVRGRHRRDTARGLARVRGRIWCGARRRNGGGRRKDGR